MQWKRALSHLEVRLGLVLGSEDASGLDHKLSAGLAPGDLSRVPARPRHLEPMSALHLGEIRDACPNCWKSLTSRRAAAFEREEASFRYISRSLLDEWTTLT